MPDSIPTAPSESPAGSRARRGRSLLSHFLALAGGLCAVWLAVSCGEQVHEVHLSFTNDGAGTRGFVCKEAESGAYLARRAVTSGHASVVVDYVRLGGFPLCRPIKLLDWCREQGCEILADLRTCIDLPPVAPDAGEHPGPDPVSEALFGLQGSLVTGAAPEEPVLVRVVATAQTCAEVEAGGLAFACASLIGCANSCPVFLPAVGDVPLDLDVTGENCESSVVVCASSDLGNPESSCPGTQ